MGRRKSSIVKLRSHFDFIKNYNKARCVTKALPLLSLTMAPACAKLDLLVMTLPELYSHPLLDAHVTRVSWLVWDKRMPMLEMKLNPREVSSPRNTQLNTESSPTGMTWKRSGITPSTTNSVLHQKSNPFFSLKPHLTQRLTVKR